MKYPAMIFDTFSDILENCQMPAYKIAELFNRERKWVYEKKSACNKLIVDTDFLVALDGLGYEIVIQKKEI